MRFNDLIDLFDFFSHFWCGGMMFGDGESHFIMLAFEDICKFFGKNFGWCFVIKERFETKNGFDTVDLF